MSKDKERLIQALIEQPSSYGIEVLDNSMLPTSLIDEKIITITVKPPSLEVLAKCALPCFQIPEEIREGKDLKVEDAIKYTDQIAEVLAILAHGKKTSHPEWMVPFFKANLTGKELYVIFYESIMKLQTDFFLNSFQIVSQNNPMMMMKQKEDSIPTDS